MNFNDNNKIAPIFIDFTKIMHIDDFHEYYKDNIRVIEKYVPTIDGSASIFLIPKGEDLTTHTFIRFDYRYDKKIENYKLEAINFAKKEHSLAKTLSTKASYAYNLVSNDNASAAVYSFIIKYPEESEQPKEE